MEPSIASRITSALGNRPVRWTSASESGCTANQRWVVCLSSGQTAFVKAAVDERTAGWLRREYFMYSHLTGSLMPQLLGWCDNGEWPLLIIEDLSQAHWPPPWTPASIHVVRQALNELAAIPVSGVLRETLPLMEVALATWPGWNNVAAEPGPFLSLGLCSPCWLDKHLSTLIAAADATVLEGDSIVHMDVRSDNLCLLDGKALLVDWNWARIGNPIMDVAGWLPSLHAEGGPTPETILPSGATSYAAKLSGYWASQTGLPPIPEAPRVRPLQLMQLKVALPWAIRSLELPMPTELNNY